MLRLLHMYVSHVQPPVFKQAPTKPSFRQNVTFPVIAGDASTTRGDFLLVKIHSMKHFSIGYSLYVMF
jgi:hypothetical protein